MQLWKSVRPRFGKTLTIGLLLGIAGSSPPSLAAVWNVYPDSTGDAPTIQAAVDAAVEGDVIRLWPGEYREIVRIIQKSLVIESATGPGSAFLLDNWIFIQETEWARIENLDFAGSDGLPGLNVNDVGNTTIRGCSYSNYSLPVTITRSIVTIDDCIFDSNVARLEFLPGALFLSQCESQITNCVFKGNSSQFGEPGGLGGGGGALFVYSASTDRHTITGNLFLQNTAPNGGAAWISGIVEFFRNTVVFNESQSGAVVIQAERGSEIYANVFAWNDPFGLWVSEEIGLSGGQCWCNAFWENNGFGGFFSHGTGWWGLCLGPGDPNDTDFDDINLDPEFCSPEFQDFGLKDTSPLLPANHPSDAESCATTIGAFDEDCITNPVIRLSWGRIKARYE